jgi:hypothetical protein
MYSATHFHVSEPFKSRVAFAQKLALVSVLLRQTFPEVRQSFTMRSSKSRYRFAAA